MKELHRQREWEEEVVLGRNMGWLWQGHFPLGGGWSAGVDQMASPVLTMPFLMLLRLCLWESKKLEPRVLPSSVAPWRSRGGSSSLEAVF